ncbi:MAG: FtsB family cell division protein [Actinomycetes bacterium]
MRANDAGEAEGRPRPNLTGRAAMLALVVCLLAISLAYPLREYLSQRSDIADHRVRVAEQEKRVAALRDARERWRDPAFVEAQARERLRYVMPGETSYVVLEADEAPAPEGLLDTAPAEAERNPWFTDLWRSVESAGVRADGEG